MSRGFDQSAPDPDDRAGEPPLTAWSDLLEARFPDRHGRVEVYASTASTQDAARRRVNADPGNAHGLVVTTGRQTAGRGRLHRRWNAPGESCLTVSLAYRVADLSPDRLAFAASVALAETLDRWLRPAGVRADIKWPNDVYVGSRKLAGILVEQAAGVAIIGLGVNVTTAPDEFPPALARTATSLTAQAATAHRFEVLLELLSHLDHALTARPLDNLLDAWRERSTLLAQTVRFAHRGDTITGHVIDLDPHLGLIVRREAGEIIHLPAAGTSVVTPAVT